MSRIMRGRAPGAPKKFNVEEHKKKLAGWKDRAGPVFGFLG